MANLAGVADRLRAVKEAQERFLALFAVECMATDKNVLDRVARDAGTPRQQARPDWLQRVGRMDD